MIACEILADNENTYSILNSLFYTVIKFQEATVNNRYNQTETGVLGE